MAREDVEVVVVGAGIAGLTAGWALRDRRILVLEASERVGGRIRSEPRGRYWLNLGAHLFGGPGTLLDRLVEETGLETRPIPGDRMALAFRGRVVAHGRPELYPLRLPLALGARLSFIRAGLRLRAAAHGYLRAARRGPGETTRQVRARVLAYRDDRTFADLLGPLHPDVAGIFRAVAERVTAEPEQISAGCGAALFALVWGGTGTLARNLIGGSARLPEALARGLGDRVVTGAVVREVVQTNGGVRVRFTAGGRTEEVPAAQAILATPAHVTREIAPGLPDDTRAALGAIPYGPFVCGAFLTDEAGPMPWDRLYAVAVPEGSFNMLFNHANPLRGPGAREPGGSLMVYGGGDRGRRLLAMTDEAIRAAFLRDLAAVLPASAGLVREVVIQRWERALPYAAPGRARLQPALERPLGRLHLAGDYLEFPEMEAAAVTGLEAAEAARRAL
jgi:oxygen-dependent protoporphyrinogen oxidase